MARNRTKRQKKKQLKVEVPKIKCDSCAKEFSSISSLNSHKKSKHDGRGWMCPVCQITLASKYALIRHTGRAHRAKQVAEVKATAQEHEVFVKDDVAEMSEAAKSALIVKLRLKVEKKDKVIAELKCKLKNYIRKAVKKTVEEGIEEENSSNVDEETDSLGLKSGSESDASVGDDDQCGADSNTNELQNENDAVTA